MRSGTTYTYLKNWDGRDFMGVHGYGISPFFNFGAQNYGQKVFAKNHQELFISDAAHVIPFEKEALKNDRNYSGII